MIKRIKLPSLLVIVHLLLPFLGAQDKPNVLMIAIDDMNDWVGAMGNHPDIQTPNIDRLAASGVLFNNAHCQFPVCGPSRTSVFSGYRPTTTNVLNNDGKVKDSAVWEMAEVLENKLMHEYLRDFGYKTMAVGKLMHNHIAIGSVDESGGRLKNPKKRSEHNYDNENTGTDWGVFPGADSEMADYRQADWAIARLGEKQEKPFLLMLGFQLPHVPWIVPQKWWDLYDSERVSLAPYKKDDRDDLPGPSIATNILNFMPQTDELLETNKLRQATHSYLASISFIDHQVGRVLRALDSSIYKSNTIIILWSDHGYLLGEKGSFQKHSLWQRATHVPLIISSPDMDKGLICTKPVELLDLYPTLVDLCGLPENPKNEGLSLKALIGNPDSAWSKLAVTTYRKQEKHSVATGTAYDGRPSHSVFDERFHYILYPDGNEEFYDLKADPNEWTNQASNPEFDDLKNRMNKALKNQLHPKAHTN
ncbi:MAG: sulfatase [Opitutales bacterium]|nr:sulfatase [Opitutales bacterium]